MPTFIKMIEQKLLDKGITPEELQEYILLLRSNGKSDDLRYIANACDWVAIPNGFMKRLAETLADTGVSLEEFSPENALNRNKHRSLGNEGYRLYVAEMVADKMFRTLTGNPQYRYDSAFSLDKLFDDTFKINGAKKWKKKFQKE